jgi:hypothetical protein
MLYVHPFIQLISIVCLVAAWVLGVARFRSLHLGHKVRFYRQAHVNLGRLATVGVFIGAGVGMLATRYTWGRSFMTMGHGRMGMVVLVCLLVGSSIGFYLDIKKKQHPLLAVLHGLINTIAMLLALNQIRTGFEVYKTFISGL